MAPVTVITGADGGVGRACVERLASRTPMILVDQQTGQARDDATWIAGDLADAGCLAAIGQAVADHERLGVLVHTAGVSPTMATPERIIEVDLLATARLLETIDPFVGPGTVAVLVASQSADLVPEPDAALLAELDDALAPDLAVRIAAVAPGVLQESGLAYAYAKRANQRQVVAAAPSWGARGARIVSVSPGIIDTPMGRQELDQQPAMPWMLEQTPLARAGQADEVAAVIEFLCSESASFVTGVDWLVDGGSTHQVAAQIKTAMGD